MCYGGARRTCLHVGVGYTHVGVGGRRCRTRLTWFVVSTGLSCPQVDKDKGGGPVALRAGHARAPELLAVSSSLVHGRVEADVKGAGVACQMVCEDVVRHGCGTGDASLFIARPSC